KTCLPLARYWPQRSPCLPHTTMLCHSVRSWRLPSASFQTSEVAIGNRATAFPLLVKRTSGSLPKLPIRIALLTDMEASRVFNRAVEQPSAFERALSQRANSDQQSEYCFALCSLPLASLCQITMPKRKYLIAGFCWSQSSQDHQPRRKVWRSSTPCLAPKLRNVFAQRAE